MPKFFIDFEFIEGFHKPLFGKKRHFIDLISVGIVSEDGRKYYAVSNEFNSNDADDWVRKNVISNLYDEDGQRLGRWISNKQIAEEIKQFVYAGGECSGNLDQWGKKYDVEFYGYYCDYDWVLFCSLFGRMINLPEWFPMYCIDLKQMIDELATKKIMDVQEKYSGESRFDTALRLLKSKPSYPKQKNEHNALADAEWNKELYNFIKIKS